MKWKYQINTTQSTQLTPVTPLIALIGDLIKGKYSLERWFLMK